MNRKGFTLIELLIVIIVIGILAAAMIFSSTEAVTTAKATQIISDLQLLSKAANSWYLDNYKKLTAGSNAVNGFKIDNQEFHKYIKEHPAEITKYIDRPDLKLNQGKGNYASENNNEYFAAVGGYAIYMGHSNTVCYAVYGISPNNDSAEQQRLKQKLQARAKSAGLQSYKYGGIEKGKSTSTIKEYNGEDANVFMTAFTLIDPNQ